MVLEINLHCELHRKHHHAGSTTFLLDVWRPFQNGFGTWDLGGKPCISPDMSWPTWVHSTYLPNKKTESATESRWTHVLPRLLDLHAKRPQKPPHSCSHCIWICLNIWDTPKTKILADLMGNMMFSSGRTSKEKREFVPARKGTFPSWF